MEPLIFQQLEIDHYVGELAGETGYASTCSTHNRYCIGWTEAGGGTRQVGCSASRSLSVWELGSVGKGP